MSNEPSRYPLSRWSIAGFRSIRDSTDFEFSGLNLLVGANSAGKSSVLHSILLAAQTLGNPLADRALMLNGPLVRLGLAEDIVHEDSRRQIEIGFCLNAREIQPPGYRPESVAERLDVGATFVSKANDFVVEESRVTVRGAELPGGSQTIVAQAQTQEAARKKCRELGLSGTAVAEVAKSGTFAVTGSLPERTVGARMRQFLPHSLILVANTYEEELESLRWPYLRYTRGFRTAQERARERPVSRKVLNFIRAFLESDYPDEAEKVPLRGKVVVSDLEQGLSTEAWRAVSELGASPWFGQHQHDLAFKGEARAETLPDPMDDGIDNARRFFATSVRHLGPLRAPPQPLYGLPEAASGTSVGQRGEFTAAVLSAHSRRLVLTPEPSGGEARNRPLSEAVDLWMNAMKLVSSISSQERGKLGYELHLTVEGVSRDLDLTSVGVGISQALPIVVLGLLSPPGSLLMFEQPELHLHPDVQASLGDFFLALANSGRQLVVETHSEYLVNRLRRRAATDRDLDVPDVVRLFFFEREGSASAVRDGHIAPGGVIDWPRGFLDTAAREVHAIAASRRR